MCCEVFYVSYKIILRRLPRWMDRVLNLMNVPFFFIDSAGEMLFTSVFRTLLQYITKIRKGIRNPFAAILVDFPRFRIALTSHSSASGRVLPLPDRLLQVCYI